MIDVIVARGEGMVRGEDVIDPLISEVSVAVARGRMEIDNSTPVQQVPLTVKYRDDISTGQLVTVVDALQGAAWTGKIISVEAGIDGQKQVAKLIVEKPL